MLDSGALYRLVALAAQRKGVNFDADDNLATIADELDVTFTPCAKGVAISLEGDDVSWLMQSF